LARARGEIFADPARGHNVVVVGGLADRRQRISGLEQHEQRRVQEDAGNVLPEDHSAVEPPRQSVTGEPGDRHRRYVHHIKSRATTGAPTAKTVALVASHAIY